MYISAVKLFESKYEKKKKHLSFKNMFTCSGRYMYKYNVALTVKTFNRLNDSAI